MCDGNHLHIPLEREIEHSGYTRVHVAYPIKYTLHLHYAISEISQFL